MHACIRTYDVAMAQMTIRASEDLVDRVRTAARDGGRSMNEYVVSVLEAATSPDYAGSEAERVRTRLRLAGLLEESTAPRRPARQPREVVDRARDRAGRGKPLSEIVIADR
jgi:hypothetical protein